MFVRARRCMSVCIVGTDECISLLVDVSAVVYVCILTLLKTLSL